MIEKVLKERLLRIFDLKKVSFDLAGDSQEQECLFVEVSRSNFRVVDAREIGQVVGTIRVFAQSEKIPMGFFAKAISEAPRLDTSGFFFGPEETVGRFMNIVERKLDFTFLFDSQYDPSIGTITSLTTAYQET